MARTERTQATPWRHARLISLAVVLVGGWLFILWQNQFDVTPPLVFVMLAYLAVVMTTWNLWRTGAAAVATDDEDDQSFVTALGARGELEREKRTLLKAIRETEFDQQMGKLSKLDAEQMIGGYRARAIDVLKQIDLLELGEAGTVRERILREAKARVAIANSEKKAAAAAAKKDVGADKPAKADAVKIEAANTEDAAIEGEAAETDDAKLGDVKSEAANTDDVKSDPPGVKADVAAELDDRRPRTADREAPAEQEASS